MEVVWDPYSRGFTQGVLTMAHMELLGLGPPLTTPKEFNWRAPPSSGICERSDLSVCVYIYTCIYAYLAVDVDAYVYVYVYVHVYVDVDVDDVC